MDVKPIAKVLVVDDNEANRFLAQSTLEDEGYQAIVAAGGAEGIALFETERPDCVLLDVRMPEIDGFTVCERIRTLPGGSHTPIIFLTALRDVETFDRALHAGGDDFLSKPVRPSELTVRVQAALKIRNMRAELHGHYDLLKQQRDDLMRLQLQKERLMAFVVHDLKNPVNTMDLHAQLLLRDKTLTNDSRESASHIRDAARQLTRMILNLLDVSKGDEGKLVVQRADVDLRELVGGILSDLEASARSRNVHLKSVVTLEKFRADEDLLRRMLINLVENAIRHAPQESTVSVVCRQLDSAAEIHVTDSGNGVPTEMREKIFDPFVQVDEGLTSRSGRGLGLAFCKLAVLAHGGSIRVEDAAPGARFCMQFPLSVEES